MESSHMKTVICLFHPCSNFVQTSYKLRANFVQALYEIIAIILHNTIKMAFQSMSLPSNLLSTTSSPDFVGNLVTSREMINASNEILASQTDEAIDEMNIQIFNQTSVENNYLRTKRQCPPEKIELILNRLGGLDSDAFLRITQEEFYNSDVMKMGACLLESISSPSPGDVTENQRIKEFITNRAIFQPIFRIFVTPKFSKRYIWYI